MASVIRKYHAIIREDSLLSKGNEMDQKISGVFSSIPSALRNEMIQEKQKNAERSDGQRLYSVGEICARFGITRKTLFYYDRIGLLLPTERQGVQNFKLYDASALERIRRIRVYREAGLTIREIARLLDCEGEEYRSILEEALVRMRSSRNVLTEQMEKVSELLADSKEET